MTTAPVVGVGLGVGRGGGSDLGAPSPPSPPSTHSRTEHAGLWRAENAAPSCVGCRQQVRAFKTCGDPEAAPLCSWDLFVFFDEDL